MFWVHASNAARFEQSYRDIANCVKISKRRNPKADIYQLVHDWLRNEMKRKWILILDNVDNASFLLESRNMEGGKSRPLVSYLPQCQNGTILVTTRTREAALKLVEESSIIAVNPMEESHAITLLKKKLGTQSNSGNIGELAAALEYMPLAIVQAAAYISQRAPRCSVQQYLETFKKSDRKRSSLLDHEGGQLRRDREAKNSIIITWQISFDHICDIRPSAANLLSLMSFFDRQGIPEALLRNRGKQRNTQQDRERPDEYSGNSDEENASQSSMSDEFEDDILALRNYSFISVDTHGTTFEMHRLVQLAMRKWLKAHGQLEQWKQQFVRNLCAAFPTGEYENWPRCQELFPHARSALAQQPEEQSSLRYWAQILYRAAWYARGMGNLAEAEGISVRVMKVMKEMLGVEHEGTLSIMELVAYVYLNQGRGTKAEELEVPLIGNSQGGARDGSSRHADQHRLTWR